MVMDNCKLSSSVIWFLSTVATTEMSAPHAGEVNAIQNRVVSIFENFENLKLTIHHH
jgi:hypothetical protein